MPRPLGGGVPQCQTSLTKWEPLTGVQEAKCMEDAKAVFLASEFKCESFIGQDAVGGVIHRIFLGESHPHLTYGKR